FPTPPAENGEVVNNPEGVWVGINLEPDGVTPVYMVGQGDHPPDPDDRELPTKGDLLLRLQSVLEKLPPGQQVDVTINANPDVQEGLVREVSVALEKQPLRGKIRHKYIGVSERTP